MQANREPSPSSRVETERYSSAHKKIDDYVVFQNVRLNSPSRNLNSNFQEGLKLTCMKKSSSAESQNTQKTIKKQESNLLTLADSPNYSINRPDNETKLPVVKKVQFEEIKPQVIIVRKSPIE